MSSVNNVITWESISSQPRSYFEQQPHENRAAILPLFIKHAPEVNKNLNLLSKLCQVLTGAQSSLIKAATQVFKDRLSIHNTGVQIRADANELNSSILEGETPLIFACRYLELAAIKKILETEDVNQPNLSHTTPLMIASRLGRTDLVALLLQKGANPNAQDDNGFTPLSIACQSGQIECVKVLLPKTDPALKTKEGWSPLILAAIHSRSQIVQYILEHGTEADFAGLTPLDVACLAMNFNCIDSLISGSSYFSGKIHSNSVSESRMIDKIKVINKFYKLSLSLNSLTQKIVEEYYTKKEIENDLELHCARLGKAQTADEIRQAATGAQLFIDELPIAFAFFARFYRGTPESILSLRKQIMSALEGAKRRLRALSIKKEELQEEFGEKDIFQILFEWGVHPKENKSVNYRTALGQLQIDGMIDETYIEYLGVTREQIKAKGLHFGKDLIEQMQIDNELEILISSKAPQEELMKALDKKMKREELGGKTYFKEIRNKLRKNEISDSLLEELIKKERNFNIAILKQEFKKKIIL